MTKKYDTSDDISDETWASFIRLFNAPSNNSDVEYVSNHASEDEDPKEEINERQISDDEYVPNSSSDDEDQNEEMELPLSVKRIGGFR
jgi:hypothetical protein